MTPEKSRVSKSSKSETKTISTAFAQKYVSDLKKLLKKVEEDKTPRMKPLIKKEFEDGEWILGFGWNVGQTGRIQCGLFIQNPVRSWFIPVRSLEQFLTMIDLFLDMDQEGRLITAIVNEFKQPITVGRRAKVEEEEEEVEKEEKEEKEESSG